MLAMLSTLCPLTAANATEMSASDARVRWQGRTRVRADGSVHFDWQGVMASFGVVNASYVLATYDLSALTHTSSIARTRVFTSSNRVPTVPVPLAEIIHSPQQPAYVVAAGKQIGSSQGLAIHMMKTDPPGAGPDVNGLTLVKLTTDGAFTAPIDRSPLPRSIVWVGDSMMGTNLRRENLAGAWGFEDSSPGACVGYVSDYSLTYAAQVCANLSASCAPLGVGGKGLYRNCCDDGKTMADYFLQTCEGDDKGDYFNTSGAPRAPPDDVVVNLGTNDQYWADHHGHGADPAFRVNFSAAYVGFLQQVQRLYAGSGSRGGSNITFWAAAGPMDNGAVLLNATRDAVATARALGLDARFVDLTGAPTDGCMGHPGIGGHREMAARMLAAMA